MDGWMDVCQDIMEESPRRPGARLKMKPHEDVCNSGLEVSQNLSVNSLGSRAGGVGNSGL